MSVFHPDQNLPDCMMPDGGDCCAGHSAVCEDWYRQRRRIAALEETVAFFTAFFDYLPESTRLTVDADKFAQARAALALSSKD
jgi:hypothetical protein